MSLGLMIDKKKKRSVRLISHLIDCHALSPVFSALSLRLFGKDITTVGQQKAERQNGNLDRVYHTETPVEHAPMFDEVREPTPVIDGGHALGEAESSEE